MLTRSALIYLSRQEGLKEFATRFAPFRKITRRFIAGEDIDEAVAAIDEVMNLRRLPAVFGDDRQPPVERLVQAKADMPRFRARWVLNAVVACHAVPI